MKRLKLIIASLSLILSLSVALPVYAADSAQTAACEGIGLTSDNKTCSDDAGNPTVTGAVHTAVNILSYIVGIAAIIMIIIGSFKYVTSSGDSNRISSAKSTIMYALIGLVVAALAQVLVVFVFKQATTLPPAAPAEQPCKVGEPC